MSLEKEFLPASSNKNHEANLLWTRIVSSSLLAALVWAWEGMLQFMIYCTATKLPKKNTKFNSAIRNWNIDSFGVIWRKLFWCQNYSNLYIVFETPGIRSLEPWYFLQDLFLLIDMSYTFLTELKVATALKVFSIRLIATENAWILIHAKLNLHTDNIFKSFNKLSRLSCGIMTRGGASHKKWRDKRKWGFGGAASWKNVMDYALFVFRKYPFYPHQEASFFVYETQRITI